MADVTIRPMTAGDFGPVYELGSRCFDRTTIPYNYWSIGNVAKHLETSGDLCLVAEDNGRVVGFLLCDETFETDEQSAYIEWLAVDEEHRRRGLGRRLTEAALARVAALGKTRVVLEVAAPNAGSRKLFEQLGFEEEVTVTYLARRMG
jgi:[ribosomal protein S18]-alanine N-acetyltransferase